MDNKRPLSQRLNIKLALMIVLLSIFISAVIVVYNYTTTALNITARGYLFLFNSLFFAILVFVIFGASWWISNVFARPLTNLISSVEKITNGDQTHRIQVNSADDIGQLGKTINHLVNQMDASSAEVRDAAQIESNEAIKRSYYLAAAAKVGQAASSILETDELVQTIVDLIQDQFNLYYVGLFLLEGSGEFVVLRAGTGQAGRKMIQRGHSLKVGEGMIGWCITNAQTRIAQEVEGDGHRLATKELPKTRSEVALPLRSRNEVIGALTVQSEHSGTFDQDTLTALETMAGLVAVAIDNSILYSQSQEALASTRRAYRQLTMKAWGDFLNESPNQGVYCDRNGVRSIGTDTTLPMEKNDPAPRYVLPILVRDTKIGEIMAHKSVEDADWSQDEMQLVQKLTEQLSIALESARLYKESQLRADRERLAGEITAKIRASNDPGTILRTAVRELRLALQVDKAQVLIRPKGSANEEFKAGSNGNEERIE